MAKKKGVSAQQEAAVNVLYTVLDEYVQVEEEYKKWERRRKELNTRLKEAILVPNEAQVVNDIMYEKQVTSAATIKADLIRALLKQEGREDLIEAATETSERVTLKVKRLKQATV